MKKGILMLIIGLCSLTILLAMNNIYYKENSSTPDSGYDYDYGGGSSGGYSGGSSGGYSGGSSGGSSSYDHDYDYNYGGSSGRSHSSGHHTKCTGDWWSDCGGNIFVLVMSIFLGIPILCYVISRLRAKARANKTKRNKVDSYFIYNPKPYDILTEAGIDPNYVLNRAYQIYYDVQIAWMNYDYNSLRRNLSDELYNEYKIQLDTLRLKNQQNIMSDISQSRILIVDAHEIKGVFTILVRLAVNQRDYIVNMSNPNKPLRGNKRLHDVYYELTFEMTKERTNFCSNCGAKLDGNVKSQNCPYCNSIVISKNHDLIMLKKHIFDQNIFNKR